MANVIQTIKVKRGTKAKLIAKLTGDNKLLAGEPAFESDTGQLKLGDGSNNYADLPYVGGEDGRFIVEGSPKINQVFLYDTTVGKWVNKDLADEKSIIYLAEHGLEIKGYAEAQQGYMLVKDQTNGIAWVKPLDDSQLQAAVVAAQGHATTAGNYATQAGNSAAEAATSAGNAATINQQTMAWVNNKFWWGTLEEYNALESINPGTFYFITAEN